MNPKGFSLTEIIVVMALMGIILAIAVPSYNQWQRKAAVERQTREIMADINTARMDSVFRKARHSVIFQPTSYIMKRYSSADEARNGDTGKGVVLSRTLPYQISKASGGTVAGEIVEFNIRGYTFDVLTVRVNADNSGAAFDCIAVSEARTNIGKMEGSSCVQK